MFSTLCLFEQARKHITRIRYEDGAELPGIKLNGRIHLGADVKGAIAAVSLDRPSSVAIVDLRKAVVLQTIQTVGRQADWTALSDDLRVIAFGTDDGHSLLLSCPAD